MELTNETLKNIAEAVKFLRKKPNDSIFMSLRKDEPRYIEWMVTRNAAGAWYYGDRWIYWENSHYVFSFDPSMVPEEGPDEEIPGFKGTRAALNNL